MSFVFKFRKSDKGLFIDPRQMMEEMDEGYIGPDGLLPVVCGVDFGKDTETELNFRMAPENEYLDDNDNRPYYAILHKDNKTGVWYQVDSITVGTNIVIIHECTDYYDEHVNDTLNLNYFHSVIVKGSGWTNYDVIQSGAVAVSQLMIKAIDVPLYGATIKEMFPKINEDTKIVEDKKIHDKLLYTMRLNSTTILRHPIWNDLTGLIIEYEKQVVFTSLHKSIDWLMVVNSLRPECNLLHVHTFSLGPMPLTIEPGECKDEVMFTTDMLKDQLIYVMENQIKNKVSMDLMFHKLEYTTKSMFNFCFAVLSYDGMAFTPVASLKEGVNVLLIYEAPFEKWVHDKQYLYAMEVIVSNDTVVSYKQVYWGAFLIDDDEYVASSGGVTNCEDFERIASDISYDGDYTHEKVPNPEWNKRGLIDIHYNICDPMYDSTTTLDIDLLTDPSDNDAVYLTTASGFEWLQVVANIFTMNRAGEL